MAGLSSGNTNTDFADVDFGILLTSNGTVYVFESGASRGVFGSYQAGDRFRVSVEGGVVRYRRNGVLFYTSGGTPTYPLLVDTALYTPERHHRSTWCVGRSGTRRWPGRRRRACPRRAAR